MTLDELIEKLNSIKYNNVNELHGKSKVCLYDNYNKKYRDFDDVKLETEFFANELIMILEDK